MAAPPPQDFLCRDFFFFLPFFFQNGSKKKNVALNASSWLICIGSSCWCLSGGLLWGVCCVCTPRSSHQSSEFIYQGLCPGLHTGNNNSYGCSRHTPTSSALGPPKTHVCQSHNPCPQPFLSPPRPPPRHAHGSDRVLILLLCNCLDDNAQHIMERHGSICEPRWRQYCLHGAPPCPEKCQWCMHIVWIRCIPCFCRSLVTPSCSCAQIPESCSRVISIHLCGFNVRDEDESDEIVAEQIAGGRGEKNPVFLVLGFRLFSPVS